MVGRESIGREEGQGRREVVIREGKEEGRGREEEKEVGMKERLNRERR